jgi:PEGA domain
MIPYAFRRALFFFFVTIFLISAPLVVLYTAGYRFNRTNNVVSQTGTLSLASTPRGAEAFFDGQNIHDATPAVLQRLSLGTRRVRLEKSGYHAWERTVNIQSGSTTYVTAPLFLDELPILLAPASSDWERAQEVRGVFALELPHDIILTPTDSGVEVSRTSLGSTALLALLASDDYVPLAFGDEDLFLQNSKGDVLALSLTRAQTSPVVGKNFAAFSWDPEERRLVWSDGLEIHIFSAVTGTQELITRQSDTIQSLAFGHHGESLLIGSNTGITGVDLLSYVDGRMQTPLTSFSEPTDVWFSEDGSTAYLETATNLSSLALTP